MGMTCSDLCFLPDGDSGLEGVRVETGRSLNVCSGNN